MSAAAVKLGSDLVALLSDSGQPVHVAARELIVLELYREGRVSSGRAAELLGLSTFLKRASDAGILYFDMFDAEWERELQQGQTI